MTTKILSPLWFYYFILFSTLGFFLYNFDVGIELTDESYLLLLGLHPLDIVGRVNNSGLISNFLLKISDYNIFYFRISGFVILFAIAINFSFIYAKFLKNVFKIKTNNIFYIILISIFGIVNYYRNWTITPSYNLYNLMALIIFLKGMLYIAINSKKTCLKNIYLSAFYLSVGSIISFISKPTTTLILIFIIAGWFYIFSNLRNFLKISALGTFLLTLFLFFYIFFFYENISIFLKDIFLGIELKTILDPRYNILYNLISCSKQFLYHILYLHFLHVFLFFILIIFFKIRCKHFFDQAIILISTFHFLVFQDIIMLTFYLGIYFLLFYFHLSKILNLEEHKKKFIFIQFFLLLLIFSYVFGSNTNIIVLSESAFFFFAIINLNFFIFQKHKKIFLFNKYNLFLISLLVYFILNIFDNFQYPRRYNFNIIETINQKKTIQIPGFTGSIKVDNFIYDLQRDIKLNLLSHKWTNNEEALVDLTGRNPGLNLLLGAKFLKEPWWGGGYIGTEKKAKKLISSIKKKTLEKSWIVTNDNKTNSIPASVLNIKNLDINKDYFLAFTINKNQRLSIFQKNKIENEILYFWKPITK
jgi:hypothetical protein